METTFHYRAEYTKEGIARILSTYLCEEVPVILCIGSDLVIGDCLAPLVGSFLREQKISTFLYGTLQQTVTAKELPKLEPFLNKINPHQKRLVIDAAIGSKEEIGTIKVRRGALHPGSGVNKRFSPIGDVSILGIVAERTVTGYSIHDLTRMKLIYSMAKTISDGICLALNLISQEKYEI
ncbi:MAG: spore protease YyaC [Clostridia bacterium]|nr:spore protease YyaC [Clostridia bacterium]